MNENRSSITQYGYAALLLALVAALFGLRLDGDGGKSAGKAAAEKKATDKAESPRQEGRAKDHREFVEGYFRPPALVPNCEGPASRPWPRQDEADNTEVLIFSIPDPVATPFGCWFDQVVSAVTRAAANVNYAPASHWFPWEADPQSKPQDPPLPFDICPGVVVFRDNDRVNQFLLVLLVGETPNSIRARPLGAALNLAREIDSNRTNPRKEVRLVAPFFSGAECALLQTLERWTKQSGNKVTFNIISGSANGLNLKLPREVLGADTCYSLRSTVVPFEYQQEAALQFLKEHRVGNLLQPKKLGDKRDDSDVALLVESNSGFGQAQLKEQLPKKQAINQPLYLPYPMHLSRVRARQEEWRLERERRYNPDVIGTDNGNRRLRIVLGPETISNLDEATTPRLVDRSVEDITAAIRRHHIRYVGLLVTDPQDVVYFVDRIKRDCPDVECFVTGMDLSYALPENRHCMRGVVIASSYPLFPPNQGWTDPSDRVRETFPNESAQGCYNATVVHLAELAGPGSHRGDAADQRWRALREYGPPLFARTEQNVGRPPVWVFSVGENGRYVPHGVSFYDPAEIKVDNDEFMAVGSQPHAECRWVRWPALGTFAIPAVALLVGMAATFVVITRGRWAVSGVPSSAAFALRERRGLARAWHWLGEPPGKAEVSVRFWQSFTLTIVIVALTPLFFTVSFLLGRPFVVNTLKVYYLLVAAAALTGMLTLLALAFQALCLGRLVRAAFRTARPSPEAWLPCLGTLLCVGASVAVVFHFLAWAWVSEQAERVLFVERAVNMSTGFSVLPPVAVLTGGVVILGLNALKRQYLGRRFPVRCPYPRPKSHDTRFDPMTARACADLNRWSHRLHKELMSLTVFCRRRWRWVLLASGIYVVGAWLILDRYRRTPEGDFWDLLFISGFVVLAGGVVLNLVRFLACWKDLETLLKRIALLPMVRAFDRLPRKAADLFGGYFLTRRPRGTHLVIPLHLLRQLRADVRAAAPTPERPEPVGPSSHAASALARMPTFDDSPAHIAEDLDGGTAWPNPLGPRAEGEYPAPPLNRLSQDARTLVGELARYWPHHSVADAFGEAVPAEGDERKESAAAEKTMPPWVRIAEDFVAIQVIIFLSQFFIQLWALAKILVWASVALLLAATVYPFQPERLILSLQFALLLTVSGSILWVLTRVNKDEIISRVTRSTPNKFNLNWDFAQKTLLFLGPIALVLLASVSGRLRSLVEPFLDMIR